MSDHALVELNGVSAGYGRRVILENLQLTIQRGRFVGLAGSNGSGKTTLLKTLIGILPPVRGAVRFHVRNGRVPILGYVPQSGTLDPLFPLTALDVALMGTCGRVGPVRYIGRQEKAFTRDCLERTGAGDFLDQSFMELSGGQKQRVLIARALVTRPDLLLLDEPTTGLDASASLAIMDLLRDLHRESGLTLIMVNHELPVVRQYAEEVIWLHQGRLQHGSAEAMLAPDKINEMFGLKFH